MVKARFLSARVTRPAPSAMLSTGALCCAKGFVTELRVANVGRLDDEQQLDGNLVGDEAVMRELRRCARVGHALAGAESVTPRSGGAICAPSA